MSIDPPHTAFTDANTYREGVLDQRSGKEYLTSTSAMLECNHFDDLKIFSQFRITTPPSHKTLGEMYIDRMKQLRKKYDYLELSWGGGHDSTMILKASEQADCPLDMITMQTHGNPEHVSTGFNSEIHHNLHYVLDYVKRFPDTKVRYLDIDECYQEVVKHHHDHDLWNSLTTQEMLDDICRISTDYFVPERIGTMGAILTGQGWKNALYNSEHDIWSLYLADSETNQRGAISFHVPTVRFFETHDIMHKVGDTTRTWYHDAPASSRDSVNITGSDKIWTVNNEWIHEQIMYPELKGKIFHDGKSLDDIIPWQEQPRFSFWMNGKAREKYKEYFEWIKTLDKNIHPSCFNGDGGVLGDGRKYVRSCMVDF
tara:strand:- start:3570 stop:4679 length:1110 start_codon:yes stop_codon:yes gene_type:complete